MLKSLLLAVLLVTMQKQEAPKQPEFGTIAGLESMHYGSGFGCLFERHGQPYRADYAAMARAFGARGVAIERADDLGPAIREALASNLPTVIQAPMENVPTPTPGHWDINDVYRRGA